MPVLVCRNCKKTMKYPQLVSSTTPASLQAWLEGELESRGIDGVYTRYILSLLQEDNTDLDPPECEHLFDKFEKSQYRQTGNYHNLGKKLLVPLSGKSRHHRWKSWEKEKLFKSEIYHCNCMVLLDSEERKKSVAVECLKSASEQKIDIEKLIDEVYAKLKNIKTSTDIGENAIKENFGTKVLISSPQEQAEKYYAAFPALCGKLESLTQLCQQQQIERVSESVWERKKMNLKDRIKELEYIDIVSDEEFISDCDSSFDKQSDLSEKENEDENARDDIKSVKKETNKIPKYVNNDEPSFIVPKIKMSLHRIPFSVKCLPFTPVNFVETLIKNDDCNSENVQPEVISDDDRACNKTVATEMLVNQTEKNWKDDDNGIWNNMHENKKLDALSDNILDDSFNEPFKNEEYIFRKYAGKFNNQIASIWTPSITETSNKSFELNLPLILELSHKDNYFKKSYFSLKFLEQSINNIKSIWTVSQEDFKLLSMTPTKLFPFTYCLANNPLISHNAEMCNKQLLDNSVDYKENKDDEDFIKTIKKKNTTINNNNNNINTLHAYSSLNSEKNKIGNTNEVSTYSLWRDDISDGCNSDQDGIYSLWQTDSSVSILALEKKQKQIESYLDDKSVQLPLSWDNESSSKTFIDTCQYIKNSHWCSDDCIHAVFSNEIPLNKTKCTLTYHKGESLFVEVTPSQKSKVTAEIDLSHSDELMEQSIHELPSPDSDDLLTSPGTHFQPIQQEMSEMENSENNKTKAMILSLSNNLSSKCELSNIEIPPKCLDISEEHIEERIPLVIDEYLNKLDYEDQNHICRIPVKTMHETNPPTNHNKSYTKEMELDPDLPNFVEMWKTDYYKEKTKITDCSPLPCQINSIDTENIKSIININEAFNIYDENKIDNTSAVDCFLNSESQSGNIEHWKWSTNDDNDHWNVDIVSNMWQNITELKDPISVKDMDIIDTKNNLEALKKEIEEEEDELFRDIIRMNNETCASTPESPEPTLDNYYGYENEYFSESKQWNEDAEFTDYLYGSYDCEKQNFNCWDSSLSESLLEQYDGSFGFEHSDFESKSIFPLVPADKVLYSSDLEDEWRHGSRSSGVARKMKNRYKMVPQKKPCSFFLEGSCRRSDCKFSHDLGKITCRFWEEGSCFKGITCPFLHGYSSEGSFRHEECRHRKCNYTLDSEADFPSLSTSVPPEFEKVTSKDIPNKSSRRKRRRGKGQHGINISSSWPQQKSNKH